MSEVQKNIIGRRTVYRFIEKKVQKSSLDNAFEAARFAPSHKNTNPWRFYVMGEKTRNTLVPIVEELSRKKCIDNGLEISDDVVERARNKILKIPVLVAVTSQLSPDDSFRQEEDYAASVCAIHNFVLSLWEEGIGSQWSTGSITRHKIIYDALAISPEKERVIGLLKVGYPEKIPEPKKKALSEIRFYLD